MEAVVWWEWAVFVEVLVVGCLLGSWPEKQKKREERGVCWCWVVVVGRRKRSRLWKRKKREGEVAGVMVCWVEKRGERRESLLAFLREKKKERGRGTAVLVGEEEGEEVLVLLKGNGIRVLGFFVSFVFNLFFCFD